VALQTTPGAPIPPAESTQLDHAAHIIAPARRIGPVGHDQAGAIGIAEICFDVSVTLRQLGLTVKGSLDASFALREGFVPSSDYQPFDCNSNDCLRSFGAKM
jgi:hypothetical protein